MHKSIRAIYVTSPYGCLRKKLGQNWVALVANNGDISNQQENLRNEKRNMQRFSNLIFKGSKVWRSRRRKENPFFIRWVLSGEPKQTDTHKRIELNLKSRQQTLARTFSSSAKTRSLPVTLASVLLSLGEIISLSYFPPPSAWRVENEQNFLWNMQFVLFSSC